MEWNEFRKRNKGLGKSMQQLSQEYRASKSQSVAPLDGSSADYEFSQRYSGSGEYEFSRPSKSKKKKRRKSADYYISEPTFLGISPRGSGSFEEPSSGELIVSQPLSSKGSRFKQKALSYLEYRHSDRLCVATPLRALKHARDEISWHVVETKGFQRRGTFDMSSKVQKGIKTCLKKPIRFVAVSIHIGYNLWDYTLPDEPPKLLKTSGHANILVIDKEKKIVERYDPQGQYRKTYLYDKLDSVLEEKLQEILPFDFTYITNMDSCVRGLQYLQVKQKDTPGYVTTPHGMCNAWSLFYLDLRVTYPNLTPMELQGLARLKLEEGDMARFIKNYAAYLQKL